MMMRHPFQRILVCSSRQKKLLLAAAGPNLHVHRYDDGSLASSWSSQSADQLERSSTPPKKKRKVASGEQEARSSDEKTDKHSKAPSIVKLVASRSGNRVATITGDDKCIRVFNLGNDGQLELLSERSVLRTSHEQVLTSRCRHMPKRPCAIAITQDDAHIICGDKFGDVYALPLLVPAAPSTETIISAPEEMVASETRLEKPESLAVDKTIHLERNKRAREQQLLATGKTPKPKGIEVPGQLLLGHVSMLTDIALAALSQTSESSSKMRNYIITCDRDEHIRVSRGLPQAHIIEGYCLGHRDFVSRILIPDSFPEMLVSGGGEDQLYVWHWPTGALLHKFDLSTMLNDCISSNPGPAGSSNSGGSPREESVEEQLLDNTEALGEADEGDESRASGNELDDETGSILDGPRHPVSGLCGVSVSKSGDQADTKTPMIAVACEG